MILPDHKILEYGTDLIDPFKRENVQPGSVDLTLHNVFIRPLRSRVEIDLGDLKGTVKPEDYETTFLSFFDDDSIVLDTGEFLLGSTIETVRIPDDMVGIVEGKSSLGRLGLCIHQTAGFCDAGFIGQITLEFSNLGPRPILLRPGLRICQISFTRMEAPAERPYGSPELDSKYQNQQRATVSRYAG